MSSRLGRSCFLSHCAYVDKVPSSWSRNTEWNTAGHTHTQTACARVFFQVSFRKQHQDSRFLTLWPTKTRKQRIVQEWLKLYFRNYEVSFLYWILDSILSWVMNVPTYQKLLEILDSQSESATVLHKKMYDIGRLLVLKKLVLWWGESDFPIRLYQTTWDYADRSLEWSEQ